MGFIVDSVSEVIRLQQSTVEPAPAVIANKIGTEYVRGVGKMEELGYLSCLTLIKYSAPTNLKT